MRKSIIAGMLSGMEYERVSLDRDFINDLV